MNEILQYRFLGNRIEDYLISLGILSLSLIVILVFSRIILMNLKKAAEKTETQLDDFVIDTIKKNAVPIFYLAAFFYSIEILTIDSKVNYWLKIAAMFMLIVLLVQLLLSVITYLFDKHWLPRINDSSRRNIFAGITAGIKVLVWAAALLIFLDNIGVKVSALAAGLGIGGIAVALAAQAVLADLFSYVMLFFDRPFEIGDFIVAGDMMGTVEHIGIKTTRLRSVGGEELIFRNTDLTSSRIRNFKSLKKRLVSLKFGIEYSTPSKQLKEIPFLIKRIVENQKHASFGRSHFTAFGECGLMFETIYFIEESDYQIYMDTQQAVNLSLKEELDKRDIRFAFPIQNVRLTTGDKPVRRKSGKEQK